MISDLGGDIDPRDAKLLKFVDDSKAMKASSTPHDIQCFQVALDDLCTWEEQNNMAFNTTKFQLLRLGANKPLIKGTNIYVEKPTPQGPAKPLVESTTVKDLGILVDCEANFNPQRKAAVSKATNESCLGP